MQCHNVCDWPLVLVEFESIDEAALVLVLGVDLRCGPDIEDARLVPANQVLPINSQTQLRDLLLMT